MNSQLIIDIGNSTIVAALMTTDGDVISSTRIHTEKEGTQAYYEQALRPLIDSDGCEAEISVAALSSVVPEINTCVTAAITAITGIPVTIITDKMISRLMALDVDTPTAVGKDRICDCIGALAMGDAIHTTGDASHSWNFIVIDMGTATTINIVTTTPRYDKRHPQNIATPERATFHGGLILPGVRTSLMALSEKASLLPEIRIEAPPCIIGRNTVHSMQSGIIFGYAATIDGIIERISEEMHLNVSDYTIIGTGGMARKIIPHCHHTIHYDEHLLLRGIHTIVNNA